MNRGEIRTAVKRRLAIPSSGDGMLPDTVLNDLINNALTTISSARDWPWLLTTATLNFAPDTALLPTDFIRARQLMYNNYPVQWVQLEDYLDPLRFNTTFCWTIIGNTAHLGPAPSSNADGTLYYYRSEPQLVTDFSTPLMEPVLHNLIVAYASYLAALVRQDEARASAYMAEYQMLLNNVRDDLKQNTSRRIRTGNSWNYSYWD